ncbi:MAG: hypothetical protein WBA13_09855 [Microcoleaceae cyanobacterium]
MTDINDLINQIAADEQQLHSSQFIAPCVKGGKIKTKMSGLVYTFTPKPRKFEGWGIFKPINNQTAEVVEEAILPEISEYLAQFKPFRLRLATKLQHQTWLAYACNEADVKQRIGIVKPVAVHLVTEGVRFDQIVARWDGKNWWFEEIDRASDPMIVDQLQNSFKQLKRLEELRFSGLTPEMKTVYNLAIQHTAEFSQQYLDERRLKKALKQGGGELQQFRDQGDFWTVEWTTRDGQRHNSAISKADLTVVGAGICLSGRDRDFDLQSLVGVVEQQQYDDSD